MKKKLSRSYKVLIQNGRDFIGEKFEITLHDKLSPGSYKFHRNAMTGECKFIEFNPNSDEILELPSAEYTRVTHEMAQFLTPQVKQRFADTGFLYKRSALLWGLPGTGKSCIISRVITDVVKNNGVCLFIEDPRSIKYAFEILEDLQPETTTLVILEEIDGMISDYGDGPFLSVLDGEIQKNNVMYLAATNYIEKIPKRLLRPGRFSSVIEVNYPNFEARLMYFNSKLKGKVDNIHMWAEKSEGLSVDELKEIIQSTYIFGNPLDETLKRIRAVKNNLKACDIEEGPDFDDEDEFGDANPNSDNME